MNTFYKEMDQKKLGGIKWPKFNVSLQLMGQFMLNGITH